VKLFTQESDEAHTTLRKRLQLKYPSQTCPVRVTEYYSTIIAGFLAFCQNAEFEKELTKELHGEILDYFSAMCIPHIMAAMVQNPKKSRKVVKLPIICLSETMVKMIDKFSIKELLQKVSFSDGEISLNFAWMEAIGDITMELERVFPNRYKTRKFFVHSDSR
jgi:hypothetical protein